MEHVADLVAAGVDVVLTHGNGPQVGNLLVKNELAAAVVPPVPLDWCGAQTQGTIGFLIMDALDRALARRGVDRPVGDARDAHPGRRRRPRLRPARPSRSGATCRPTKPRALIEHGQTWEDRGDARLAARRRLAGAARDPRRAGHRCAEQRGVRRRRLPVAAGSPSCATTTARCAASRPSSTRTSPPRCSARSLDVDVLVIATDVDHAILDYGTDRARPIGRVTTGEMRAHAADGQFASGSMGPEGRGGRAIRRAGRAPVGDHVAAAHRRRGDRHRHGDAVGTVIENT